MSASKCKVDGLDKWNSHSSIEQTIATINLIQNHEIE